MNLTDWRAFAAQTKTKEGAVVASEVLVSKALLDDCEFDLQAHLRREFEGCARAFYDRDDCEYVYLSPEEYPYLPGPFAYRRTPGDLPVGAVLFIGRARVRRLDNP